MPRLSVQEAAMTGFTDYAVIDHADLTAASTVEVIEAITVPAGSAVTEVGWRLDTEFDGGATTELTMAVGQTGGDVDGYNIARSLHADATSVAQDVSSGDLLDGTTSNRTLHHTAADTIDCLFTATTANVSVLDAGQVTIYATIIRVGDTP